MKHSKPKLKIGDGVRISKNDNPKKIQITVYR